MAELKYDEVKTIGVISERTGWAKKLKLISWNGRPAKYDIREWSQPDDEKLMKGLTFTKEEAAILRDLLTEALKDEE